MTACQTTSTAGQGSAKEALLAQSGFKTITVTEWVPTTYQATRTVYKTVYVNETYTAHKTICVPEVRTYTCTVTGIFGGLLFAFSRTLWGYATITEVYTLNVALMLAVFACLLHWRRVQHDG